MKLLLINTAHDVAQYGLYLNGEVKTSNNLITTKHSETALSNIDVLLTENNLDVNDIDVFAISVGPGSFTGIRIGMSVVKGLMAGLSGKKLVTYNTLEAVANHSDHNGIILLPATKDDFYGADCLNRKALNLRVVKGDEAKDGQVCSYEVPLDGLINLCVEKVNAGEFVDVKSVSPMYLKLSQAENQLLGDKK